MKKNKEYIYLAYKSSPLGPIPIDWINTTFGEAMTGFSSGSTPSRAKEEFLAVTFFGLQAVN